MPKKILATPSELKPQPRRGLPRWAWIAASALALLGLTLVVVPFLIPWDKVKTALVAQGSQALGRPLSIGSIDLGLFSGVQVKDISLANAPGDFSSQPLFTNADAKVSVSLLSLFTGRVVINSIRFVKPTLLLETDRAGRSNLAGLGGASAAPSEPAKAAAASTGSSFPVVVNEFVIDQGDVVIRNRQQGTETAIHGLNLKLTGLSLAAAGASRLQASLNAVVQGKTIPLALVSDFKLDPATRAVDIRSCTLTLPAVVAHLKGLIQGSSAQADLGVQADVNLADLDRLLPPSTLRSLPPSLTLGGTLALALTLKGPLKRPQALALDGTLDFDRVQARDGGYPALSGLQGRLSFDKAGADLPALTLQLGGDPMTLALKAHWGDLGNLTGGASKLKADVQVHLTSPALNLDPLLALGAGGGGPSPAATGSAKAAPAPNGGMADDRALVSKGLTMGFDVDADSVLARGLKTGKLVERLRLRDRKLSTATDLDLYRGHLAERSAVDLGQVGPVYRTRVQLQGLDVGPLVDDLAAADPKDQKLQQLKGKVSGYLGFSADLHGKGLADPARTQHLAGTVSFQLKNGIIHKTDLQERLAEAIPDPSTQAVLRGDLRFNNALGELVIAGPKTTLKSFSLGSGKDWRAGVLFAQASGTLVKDGPVDFHITPHLNPAQVHVGGDLGKAFDDSRGWPTFDYITYAGPTLDQAKADFSAGLKKAATRAVTAQVRDLVKRQAGNVLKQLPGLNKLFGQ